MPRLVKGRLSAFVALAACIILFLVSTIITDHEVSVNTQAAFGDKAAVPAAVIKPEIEAPVTKIAVPFGNKAATHLSYPKGKYFSRVKRDDVTLTW